MDYDKAWKFLDDLQFFKIKLGLDSMRGFLDTLDNPHEGLKFVHIGGTNGKGSTAASLLSVLSEAGYNVGLYTSPHLSTVRERFRINNQLISEEEFASNAKKIIDVLGNRQITYFEFTTTLALLWFVERNVDIAIMEVGMGGRLDATNVINPLVSVITNVSMDHEAYLGDTLNAVSMEKAGIIKSGVPLVSGVKDDESRVVVSEKAKEVAAPMFLGGREFSSSLNKNGSWCYQGIDKAVYYDDLINGLRGEHQVENSSLALAVVELLKPHGIIVKEKDIKNGLKKAKWPGRLEYLYLDKITKRSCKSDESRNSDCLRFLLDGAHNPAGIETLKKELLSTSYDSLIGIWASMADKDIKNSLLPIADIFDKIIITRPEYERSADPNEIKKLLPDEMQRTTTCTSSVEEAIKNAFDAASSGDLVCIAGSLYLIGKAREILLGDLN